MEPLSPTSQTSKGSPANTVDHNSPRLQVGSMDYYDDQRVPPCDEKARSQLLDQARSSAAQGEYHDTLNTVDILHRCADQPLTDAERVGIGDIRELAATASIPKLINKAEQRASSGEVFLTKYLLREARSQAANESLPLSGEFKAQMDSILKNAEIKGVHRAIESAEECAEKGAVGCVNMSANDARLWAKKHEVELDENRLNRITHRGKQNENLASGLVNLWDLRLGSAGADFLSAAYHAGARLLNYVTQSPKRTSSE